MPKKSRKAAAATKSGRVADVSDDDSVFNDDNASVVSNASSGSYFKDDGEDGPETLTSNEIFEEKLRDAIDLASQKSAQGRTTALLGIAKALKMKLVPEFVEERRMTFGDIIDKSLKRGKAGEQIAAANLAALMVLHMSHLESSEEFFGELNPTLMTMVQDRTAPAKARASMAFSLGLLCFLVKDPLDFKETMDVLQKTFKEKPSDVDYALMCTEALSAWSLLATMLTPSKAMGLLADEIELFSNIMESADVDLRIACGEALAVLYEAAVEVDEDDAFRLIEPLLPQLKQLATDSHKYRSKKDRKEQKSSFRDILKFIEDGQDIYEKISFNGQEVLELDSWSTKKHYDMLCKALTSGMNLYLTESELVRDIFQLGPPLPPDSNLGVNKPSKQERHNANQLADKIRNQARGRHRDKRSAVV